MLNYDGNGYVPVLHKSEERINLSIRLKKIAQNSLHNIWKKERMPLVQFLRLF